MCISFSSFSNGSSNCSFLTPVSSLYIKCEYECTRGGNLYLRSQVAKPLEPYPNLMEMTVHSPETMDFQVVCLLYGPLFVSLGMKQLGSLCWKEGIHDTWWPEGLTVARL